ncbi:MAG: SDR family oxidoreductase [Flavobacteriales bacterium]|nr:SDR family oxidoreductase [Flavobacteriales bacterium]
MEHNILVTGSSGYLGSILVENIAKKIESEYAGTVKSIVAMDVREVPKSERIKGVTYITSDIRSDQVDQLVAENNINVVVHLAAIVSPGRKSNRELEYSIDVLGTKNILEACVKHGVKRIIVTSSGAAYGYHPDNPEWLSEKSPLRGNKEYAYSWHKKLVEEMMQEYKEKHPQLEQVIFRVSTILGKNTKNRITKLFDRKTMFTIDNSQCPFVFIWDQDLVNCLEMAIFSDKEGIYNVAGDGKLSIYELAQIQNKKIVNMPLWIMKTILGISKTLRISESGPNATVFVQYRPVLDNQKLKEEFGFSPKLSSKETFEYYLSQRSA